MTAQEVFNKVAYHLINQDKKAKEGVGCVYRTSEGLKCAAGCLIPDEEYNPCFERSRAIILENKYGLFTRLGLNEHMDLINYLQTIHDLSKVVNWKSQLRKLAKEFNLEIPRFLQDLD